MSTGAHTSSSRRRRQTSKPSMPGSITSSTIASYGLAPAIQRASSPRVATSAPCPSSTSPRRSNPASFSSSSTIRIRIRASLSSSPAAVKRSDLSRHARQDLLAADEKRMRASPPESARGLLPACSARLPCLARADLALVAVTAEQARLSELIGARSPPEPIPIVVRRTAATRADNRLEVIRFVVCHGHIIVCLESKGDP